VDATEHALTVKIHDLAGAEKHAVEITAT